MCYGNSIIASNSELRLKILH